MAEKSAIEWLAGGSTWNPIRARHKATGKLGWHCVHKNEACRNCYAEGMNAWRGTGLPYKPGHARDIETFLDEKTLVKPLQWQEGRRIFPCSMTDLFGDWVTDAMLDSVFAVMALTPRHIFLPLTKRPERATTYLKPSPTPFPLEYTYMRVLDAARQFRARWPKVHVAISDPAAGAFWPHVMMGCSVGDQRDADEFRPHMAQLAAQGWRTWVSYEPALGLVNWTGWEFLRWMVSGGESGPKARPSHPDWHRATHDWCSQHGIAYHFKQWGTWAPSVDRDRDDPDWRMNYGDADRYPARYRILNLAGGCGFHGERVHLMTNLGKKAAGRLLDGIEHNGFPEVRQ